MQDVVGKMRGEMPSDSVLSSRLKKLLEALRDEASKVPEKAAMAEIPPRLDIIIYTAGVSTWS